MNKLLRLAKLVSKVDEKVMAFISGQMTYRVQKWADSSSDPNVDGRYYTGDLTDANVVSSSVVPRRDFFVGSQHRPVLDIDLPVVLTESTTPGHFHLFIDKQMSWPVYVDLLKALAAAGIVEQGFVDVAIKRGSTMVRLPWVKKGDDNIEVKTMPVKVPYGV
jgi:hypothetical protein